MLKTYSCNKKNIRSFKTSGVLVVENLFSSEKFGVSKFFWINLWKFGLTILIEKKNFDENLKLGKLFSKI